MIPPSAVVQDHHGLTDTFYTHLSFLFQTRQTFSVQLSRFSGPETKTNSNPKCLLLLALSFSVSLHTLVCLFVLASVHQITYRYKERARKKKVLFQQQFQDDQIHGIFHKGRVHLFTQFYYRALEDIWAKKDSFLLYPYLRVLLQNWNLDGEEI